MSSTTQSRSTVVAVALAGVVSAVGCPAPGARAPRPHDPATLVPSHEDLAIDAGETTLTGSRFMPEALPPPSMLLVHGGRKANLDRLRTTWSRAVAERRGGLGRKALDGHLLATALFEAARTDTARRGALLGEAVAVISTLHERTKGETDETTLVIGAALAFAVGDDAAAEPYLIELSTRYGDRPGGLMAKTQLAYLRLRDGDDAIAQALVGGLAPTAALPETAYAIAWSRFRAVDGPGAAAAITLAAQGWTAAASQPAIDRDFLLMHARSGLPVTTAVDAVVAVADAPERRHALLYQLAAAYALAGRPDEAAAALDAAVAALPQLPEALAPTLRLLQAEYVRRAGRIDQLAAAWRAAGAAMAACASCSAGDRKALGDGLAARAVEAHTIYATTGDVRYKRAADELYAQFAALPGAADRADHATVAQYAADFARVRAPADGAQYADAIKTPLALRQQDVQACYEATLQGTPSLGGSVTLVLDIDGAGAVIGATTEPARGSDGLAAVAGCAEDRARTWPMPARPRPGTARVTIRYGLGARP